MATTITRAVLEGGEDLAVRLDAAVESLRRSEGADAVVLFLDEGDGLASWCSAGAPDLAPGMLLGTRPPVPHASPEPPGPRVVTAESLGWTAERVVLLSSRSELRPVVVVALAWVLEPPPAGGPAVEPALHFLDAVAEGLSLARRVELRVRRAVSADRDRIARDLHDHVIQRLFAVGLSLQGASERPDAVAGAVESAIDSLDETIRDVRRAIFALHERHPDPDGRADLDALVQSASTSLGFSPVLTVHGALSSVPVALRREALAVLREGLSNVVRHAQAAHVDVTITVTADEEVTVTVTDDGRGIEPGRSPRGLGIGNVLERARAMGGLATIGRGSPGGTRLRWSVPFPAAAPAFGAAGGGRP